MGADDDSTLYTPPSAESGVERRFGLANVLGALGVKTQPVRCGRFELDRKLGEGAMGVVYVAKDGDLGRDVALKLLRGTRGYASLRREARALARLNHPNVVQVLAVGEAEGQTWIVMELVQGGTLADWAASHPPQGRERYEAAVNLLLAAGRGLAAAHGAGLVHRDFKPANVLITGRGEAKVADFGLAGARDEHAATPWNPATQNLHGSTTLDPLDGSGLVVGTPLYMAPEVHLGRRADVASDQFAFAVSAWEVLHGTLPFDGENRQALLDALEAGEPAAPPPGTPTRRSITAALRRAMEPDPADRFPTMDALLQALQRRPTGRWWALGTLGVFATLGWVSAWETDAAPGCDASTASRELAGVWNADRKQTLSASLLQSEASYAETTWDTVEQAIDSFGERWAAQRTNACEAGDDGDAAEQDATVWCLRNQLQEVDAFLERLGQADPKLLERAVSVADQLPRPSACQQPETRGSGYGSPLARELQAELATAKATSDAGQYREAGEMARSVMARAQAAGLWTVVGDASYRAGSALLEIDDPGALSMLEAAYEAAVSYGQWGAATERARRLSVAHERGHRLELARTWLRHANAALQRAPDPLLEARILRAECAVLDQERKHGEALAVCERALSVIEGQPSASYVRTQIVSKIASLQGALGQFDASMAMLEQLRDEARRRRGPTHPRVGGMALNLGVTAKQAEAFELAADSYREAAEVFSVAYGPNSRWVASAYLNLSGLYVELEDYDAAEEAVVAGLAVMDGKETARTARLLHNLASARREQGRNEEALELLLRVESIETKELPLEHPQTIATRHTLGMVYMNLGRLEDAQREMNAALEMYERGTDPASEGKLRTALAELAERRGQPEQALEHAEAAAEQFAALEVPPVEAPIVLARAAALLAEAGDHEASRARIAQAEATRVGESERVDALLARARAALGE